MPGTGGARRRACVFEEEKTKPAVLHIVWNLIRGGTEGQCARVVLGLARRGCRQGVAVFRRQGFFLDRVEEACGPVYEVGIRHLVGRQTRRRVAELAAYIRRNGFGIVHAWDADAAIFGAAAARLAQVPYITSRRDLGEIYPWYKSLLMHRADRGAALVVVNAAAIRDAVIRRGIDPLKIVLLPNLLDLEEFDRLAHGQPVGLSGLEENSRLVGVVSRLDPEKDVASVIRAFGRVSADFPEARLVIVGDGPERAGLEALARDAAPQGGVFFVGESEQVPALVSRFEVGMLLPRKNEGLSNTILEYMAARKPVIASDCGGNAELVQDGVNGRLVPPGNFRAAAGALAEILKDTERARRMGREGRRRVEERNRPEVVLPLFEDLYRRAAG